MTLIQIRDELYRLAKEINPKLPPLDQLGAREIEISIGPDHIFADVVAPRR